MTALLSEAEIQTQVSQMPGWEVRDQALHTTRKFKDFLEAIAFVNRLVEPAETMGHHPDITISYNQVAIALTTHDAGGLTQKDLALAQIISQIP